MNTTRILYLSIVSLGLLVAAVGVGVTAQASGPAVARGYSAASQAESQPAYARGRILLRYKHDVPRSLNAATLSRVGVGQPQQLVGAVYGTSVPVGQEEAAVRALQKDPAVDLVTLDRQLTMPTVRSEQRTADMAPEHQINPLALQSTQGVITPTLHMSNVPGGPPLPERTLPTESPQVHAVVDYVDADQYAVRVQVYALDVETAPVVIVDALEVLDGSGTASVVIRASEYFTATGAFPIGNYLTILSESVAGSWQPLATAPWHVSTQPKDRYFLSNRYQWNLHNTGYWGRRDADIDAPEAWDVTTGSNSLTIAMISSGVALSHPDLVNKMWTNADEIPDNGLDDDGNGYVDDVQGYEFFLDEDNPDPSDDIGWGTFAAGIAAAETNNLIGMAGVSWGARIMPIKVVRLLISGNDRIPYGYLSDLIQGLHYAADNGARVIFVAPVVSSAEFEQVELLRQAVQYAASRGALVVGVVGDSGTDDAVWPALFPPVMGVGATDYTDALTKSSNFGEALGDGLVAPGQLILSTCLASLPACIGDYPIDVYGQTAWAAAQVAGVASLVWSVNPELDPDEVRRVLQDTADDLGPPGPDELYGYGRLNAGRAVRWTRHQLELDGPELSFVVDDGDTEMCHVIRNTTTGPFSWSASEDAEWLQVHGPVGTFTPSRMEVCVVRPLLPGYGTHTATLTIVSTINTQTEPVNIPVVTRYLERKWRAFLPFVYR